MFQSFIFRHGQYQEVQLTGNKRCFGRSMTFKVKEAWEVKDVEKGCSWQEDTCAPSVWELTHMYTQKSIVTKYAFLPPGQKLATFSVKCQRVNIFGFVGCTASVTTTPLDRRDKSATIRDKWVWLCSNDIIYGHWYLSSVWSSPATTRDSPAMDFFLHFKRFTHQTPPCFPTFFFGKWGDPCSVPMAPRFSMTHEFSGWRRTKGIVWSLLLWGDMLVGCLCLRELPARSQPDAGAGDLPA